MAKKLLLSASIITLAAMIMAPAAVGASSAEAFRQQNGLMSYTPPAWFLKSCFIAREKNPNYVFGPVQDFVAVLGNKTTWLIEDLELDRLEQAAKEGQRSEYSLFLETVTSDGPQYWVFVVLPHDSAQEWFDARRAYHGRKASDYYGETLRQLENAGRQGLKVKAELRFLIEKSVTRLQVPEDIIMDQYNIRPIFDLGAGRRMEPATKTQ
ncbi:MAG: hypothetical protein PVI38_06495 [Desulfobacterales bacterium]|jgi:hypothetical protein